MAWPRINELNLSYPHFSSCCLRCVFCFVLFCFDGSTAQQGLPTGSSPLGTYRCLVELYKAGKVNFEHVVTFNMDEYVGIPESHPESYHSFMQTNFFDDLRKTATRETAAIVRSGSAW